MASIRLFTGDDGQSHIEEIDPASHPDWTQLHGAQGIVFRASPPGYFSDWHVAPRRQYIITLSGEAEIGLADGTVHRLGPLNKSVTLILNPTRRSCLRRNDGVKALAFNDLFRVSIELVEGQVHTPLILGLTKDRLTMSGFVLIIEWYGLP